MIDAVLHNQNTTLIYKRIFHNFEFNLKLKFVSKNDFSRVKVILSLWLLKLEKSFFLIMTSTYWNVGPPDDESYGTEINGIVTPEYTNR